MTKKIAQKSFLCAVIRSVNKDVHAGSGATRASNKLNIYLLFTIHWTIVIQMCVCVCVSLSVCWWCDEEDSHQRRKKEKNTDLIQRKKITHIFIVGKQTNE